MNRIGQNKAEQQHEGKTLYFETSLPATDTSAHSLLGHQTRFCLLTSCSIGGDGGAAKVVLVQLGARRISTSHTVMRTG